MKDFHDLHVWERSHRLTLEIYATTLKFPREELYDLTSQIRRCTVSIARILPRAVERWEITNFNVISRLQRVPRANLITSCSSPRTWPISPSPTTQESQVSSRESERC